MGHLSNHYARNRRPSMLEQIGNKVKSVAEIAGTAKGIYDAGKYIYGIGRTLGPYIGPALRGAATLLV